MKIINQPRETLVNSLSTVSSDTVAQTKVERSGDALKNDTFSQTAKHVTPPVYERPITIGVSKEVEQTIKSASVMTGEAIAELYLGGSMFKSADSMSKEYDKTLSDIATERPELTENEWGFSVNEQGELKVTGNISAEDITYLEGKLNSNKSLVNLANEVKANFLQYTQMERDDNGGTSKLWGKYDVTSENFADIIDFKALMDGPRETQQTTLALGRQLTGHGFIQNIAEQLGQNATVRYS